MRNFILFWIRVHLGFIRVYFSNGEVGVGELRGKNISPRAPKEYLAPSRKARFLIRWEFTLVNPGHILVYHSPLQSTNWWALKSFHEGIPTQFHPSPSLAFSGRISTDPLHNWTSGNVWWWVPGASLSWDVAGTLHRGRWREPSIVADGGNPASWPVAGTLHRGVWQEPYIVTGGGNPASSREP